MLNTSQETMFRAVCLAAGKGSRMRTPVPKVLQKTCGWTLLRHVLSSLAGTGCCSKIYTVLGSDREAVDRELASWEASFPVPVERVAQEEPKGTADALIKALAVMEEENSPILVISGDSPLHSGEKLASLVSQHLSTGASITLACAELEDPSGYGRLVVERNRLLRIIEERDASPEEKDISLVNAGVYVFNPEILTGLKEIEASKETGEYYLTALVEKVVKSGKEVRSMRFPASHIYGVNNSWELAKAGMYLHRRIAKHWIERGVNFLDPYHSYLDMDVEVGEGSTLESNIYLYGKTKIDPEVHIESGTRLFNVSVGKGTHIYANCYLQDCEIKEEVRIGPMAHVRPGTVIGNKVRIGNFVEIKKSHLGEGTKVSHLSYIGDAELGKEVNIGCGFITCNYDGGKEKYKTTIENGAFVGSDVQVIAPITIGANAYIASGSTITKSIPPDSLAFARSRQINKKNSGKKLLSSKRKEKENNIN